MAYDYFYGDSAEQFSFYRIPKVLFTEARFSAMAVEAKVLYGLLLDRMSLSLRNGWLDEHGRVYIVFTVEEIMEALGCAVQKTAKLLAELEDKAGLIERKRQGLGKPNIIYVKNFIPDGGSKIKNYENQNSGTMKIEDQDFRFSKGNKTDKNKTDLNDTDLYPISSSVETPEAKPGSDADRMGLYRDILRENIEYDRLVAESPQDQTLVDEIVELMTDTLCTSRETIRIARDDKPAEAVRSRFLKLRGEHIRYVLDSLRTNTAEIRNIRQYLLSSLYNAPTTMTSYYQAQVNHDMESGP